jgi:hypothetical protein
MKHGLLAEALALPGENVDDIQLRADQWRRLLQPANSLASDVNSLNNLG